MGCKSLNLKEEQNRQGMGSSLFVRTAGREPECCINNGVADENVNRNFKLRFLTYWGCNGKIRVQRDSFAISLLFSKLKKKAGGLDGYG